MNVDVTSLGTYCSIIRFAGFTFLLDIGHEISHPNIPDSDRTSFISSIEPSEIDVVLISSAGNASALPLLANSPSFSAQILLTPPVNLALQPILHLVPSSVIANIRTCNFGERIGLNKHSFASDSICVSLFPAGVGLGISVFVLSYLSLNVLLVPHLGPPGWEKDPNKKQKDFVLPYDLPYPNIFSLPSTDPLKTVFPSEFDCIVGQLPMIPNSDAIDHLEDAAVTLKGYNQTFDDDFGACIKNQLAVNKNVILIGDVTDYSTVLPILSCINRHVAPEIPVFIVSESAAKIYSNLSNFPEFFNHHYIDHVMGNNPENIFEKFRVLFFSKPSPMPVTVTERAESAKLLKRRRPVYTTSSIHDVSFHEVLSFPCILIGGGVDGSDPSFSPSSLSLLGSYSVVFIDAKSQHHADLVVRSEMLATDVETSLQYFFYPIIQSFGAFEFLKTIKSFLKKQSFLIVSGELATSVPLCPDPPANTKTLDFFEHVSVQISPVFIEKAQLNFHQFNIVPISNDAYLGRFTCTVRAVSDNSCSIIIEAPPEKSEDLTPNVVVGKVKFATFIENLKKSGIPNTSDFSNILSPDSKWIGITIPAHNVTIKFDEASNHASISASSYSSLILFKDLLVKSLS
ncbi:hypothetical protein RCL1_000136 [Eukaryota sp. TZLM3-RCL]